MTELKTLRDIALFEDKLNHNLFAYKKDLRAEAIKWVKKEQDNLPDTWFDNCEMMIDFFNLTEEDLK